MKMQASNEKETFRNLPAEKQDRIIAEAVREFADNGFQKASVNAIVKRCNISKGSLYQYFNNKEALFLFVFEKFTLLVKRAVKAAVDQSGNGDFFFYVKQVLLAGALFIDNHPEYFQIYSKVFFEQDVPFRDELLSQVRLLSHEYFAPLCIAYKDKGQIRKDITDEMVIFILDAVIERFLQAYADMHQSILSGLSRKSGNDLEIEIDKVVDVLQRGLSPVKGE